MKRFIAAAAALGVLLLPGCANFNHEVHAGCKVTNKDVMQKVTGDKDSTHTSFTRRLSTTCGQFDVGDSFAGGFNSYDVWAGLEVGKVYDIETGGYRMGFFGAFPTVTKVTAK